MAQILTVRSDKVKTFTVVIFLVLHFKDGLCTLVLQPAAHRDHRGGGQRASCFGENDLIVA